MKFFVKCLFLILLLSVAFILFACTKTITFEDIVIVGENVDNLGEGTYTLRYKIENLEQYKKNNDVKLIVQVVDNQGNDVSLKNNQIMEIIKDKEYQVTILLSTDNGIKTKSHTYTIKAIKSPIIVFFASKDNSFEPIVKTVPFGGTLTDVPEVPEYQSTLEGHTQIIKNKYWSKQSFVNLTQSLTVYAVYEIDSTRNQYTLSFEMNGGENIDSQPIWYDEYIKLPPTPTKTDSVFWGWFLDVSFENKYVQMKMPAKNVTLYARWTQLVDNATSENFFLFELNSTTDCYTIKPKNIEEMPKDVYIPNIYNNKLVTMIQGFAECENITTLFIPETIITIDSQAFHNINSLAEVFIDENSDLTVIAENAFSNCNNLMSIHLNKKIQRIDESAFSGCNNLAQLYLPCEEPPLIVANAFDNMEDDNINLTFFVPQASMTSYEENSFFAKTNLASLS